MSRVIRNRPSCLRARREQLAMEMLRSVSCFFLKLGLILLSCHLVASLLSCRLPAWHLLNNDSECVGFTSLKLRLDLIFVLHTLQEWRPLGLRRPSGSPLPLSLHPADFFSFLLLLYFLNMEKKKRERRERGKEGKKKKKKNVIFFAGPCQLSLILYSRSHGRYT